MRTISIRALPKQMVSIQNALLGVDLLHYIDTRLLLITHASVCAVEPNNKEQSSANLCVITTCLLCSDALSLNCCLGLEFTQDLVDLLAARLCSTRIACDRITL